jgi:membrane protein
VLSGAAFLVSVGLTAFFEYLRRLPSPRFPAAAGFLLSAALAYVVPFLVTLLICFLIYHRVPDRRASARAAIRGALFTGVLWEAAKHLFTVYVTAFGSYSIVYGSLGAAVVLLVWVYYSAAVLLLGAEVTALLDGVPARTPLHRHNPSALPASARLHHKTGGSQGPTKPTTPPA